MALGIWLADIEEILWAEARALGGSAKMAYQTFRQEYLQVPPVTRAYTTACVLTTAAVVSRGEGWASRGRSVVE